MQLVKSLVRKAVDSVVLDLRRISTFKELQEEMKIFPQFIGYYCVSSIILADHSLNGLSVFRRSMAEKLGIDIRIMLELNIGSSPEEMFRWGKKLKDSGLSIVSIQCSNGNDSVAAFMRGIGSNLFEERKNGRKLNRPLVFGVGIPDHLDNIVANMIFSLNAGRKQYFNHILQSQLDGVICTKNSLNFSDYYNMPKICMDATMGTAGLAIRNGAKLVLIKEPISADAKEKKAIRIDILRSIYTELLTRSKVKLVEMPKTV